MWKRSRKAMAPSSRPGMQKGSRPRCWSAPRSMRNATPRSASPAATVNLAADMTELTYDILAETLFSGEIAAETESFTRSVEELLQRMGRVDPMDLMLAPPAGYRASPGSAAGG